MILGRLGFSVTVVERSPRPGGLMRGYVRAGVECPVGIHYLGALDEGQALRRTFDCLGLTDLIPVERMGAGGVVDRYVFDDFTFDLPGTLGDFQRRLHDLCPTHGPVVEALGRDISRAADQMHSMSFIFGHAANGAQALKVQSVGDELDRLGAPEQIRRVMSMPTGWLGVRLEECPLALHYMTLGSYLSSSWRLACSGSRVADVMAARTEELGGRIVLGEAVSEILRDGKQVAGVRLRMGETIPASIVVSAIHPQKTLELLPPGAVRPSFRNRISRLANTESGLCVHALVPARQVPELPHNVFSWRPPYRQVEQVFYQVRHTERPEWSLLTIIKAENIRVWSRWEETLTRRRGAEYEAEKERIAGQLLRDAEDVLGPLPGARVIDVYTPLTIRDWMDTPEGSSYGVSRSVKQRFQAALLSRTPLKGLSCAGQSVLAPGILGCAAGAFMTAAFIVGKEPVKEIFYGRKA